MAACGIQSGSLRKGDTTLGGKVYKVHNHISSRYRYDSPLLTFERVDSSGDVFIFDAIVGGESLLYRLSDTSNSWWMSNGFLHRFDSCVVKDMFGQPRKALYVGSYDAADTTLRTQVLLIDSIGYYTTILYGIVDGTAPPVLHEARINGVVYGRSAGDNATRHAHFPLSVGDTWQYFQIVDPNPGHPIVDVQQTTVVADTLMPNGYRYAVLRDWGSWSYMRQQGDSVFMWSAHGEWLYFDFTRVPGDTTFTTGGQPGDTVFVITTARDTFDTFGARRCKWGFGFDDPHMIDEERTYFVVDSIGVTDIHFSYAGDYYFKGARVNGVVYGNLTSVEQPLSTIPSSFRLEQNYPNPFNPSTTIRYALPQRSHVTLMVFNTLGQRIATLVNDEVEAGYHEVRFDGAGLASGVYFYRLQAGDFVQTRKLCLIR